MIIDQLARVNALGIVLASASPRRSELLRTLGLEFGVRPSRFEETMDPRTFASAAAYVRENARCKAADVCAMPDVAASRARLVIGCDTVVVRDDAVLEKPGSEGKALEMLASLRARAHVVISAVALFARPDAQSTFQLVALFDEHTRVEFADVSDAMLEAYVRTGEPMDKAGAYGIQGAAGAFVRRIDGCYFNVVGFPCHRFTAELKNALDEGRI
mmetsp:Transcript_8376/g.22057  ORF Transcript_8376/g.22057 Transcript_8376/m.22057 type:complete len:215 (+) Transcript_8376:200-844(+)